MKKLVFLGLTVSLVFAGNVLAADSVGSGVDLWRTPADGNTYYDFGDKPIPADFFCYGSAVFTEKVVFGGVPLNTSPAGALGEIDTVIHRLDEATFNAHGQAVTRVQAVALSLASVEPIETSCGSFQALVNLTGEQPTSSMVILRENAEGGYFNSALDLELRITFVPVKGNRVQPLTLDRRVEFPFSTRIPWTYEAPSGRVRSQGLISVDTDLDGVADTFVPASSNFAAGQAPRRSNTTIFDDQFCHDSGSGDEHCYWP